MPKRKLRPVLDGRWWLIGENPDLSHVFDGDAAHRVAFEKGREREHNASVDHHIVRDDGGTYHLWGCVRATEVGRVLYHWSATDPTDSPWRPTGEIIRADESAGESVDDWFGQEYIQSPFFVHEADTWYMFYGGHRAGVDAHGKSVPGARERGGGSIDFDVASGNDESLHQICLMTSPNGRDWTRHRNPDGTSRLFLGPGETRDPCVLRIGDLWYMYYAGYFDHDRPHEGAGFAVRTSKDLLEWSDWSLVHRDPQYGASRVQTECPYVLEREGYFYLFRTVNYYTCTTLVFRSEDPFDFGVGDASDAFVGRLPCAAPEFYTFEGTDYVSSSHTPLSGEQMCRVTWVEDE